MAAKKQKSSAQEARWSAYEKYIDAVLNELRTRHGYSQRDVISVLVLSQHIFRDAFREEIPVDRLADHLAHAAAGGRFASRDRGRRSYR